MINASFSLNPSFDVDLPDALTGESVLDDQFVVSLTPPRPYIPQRSGDHFGGFSQDLISAQTARLDRLPPVGISQKVLVKGDESSFLRISDEDL
jgi:hypothetical protein